MILPYPAKPSQLDSRHMTGAAKLKRARFMSNALYLSINKRQVYRGR